MKVLLHRFFINKLNNISRNKEYRILFENFASLSFMQVANYILPLITLPYLIRVLGAEKFGLIAFAQAFIQYFVIFTDFGFNLSAVKEISINRNNKKKLSEIFNSVIFIKFFLMLVSFGIISLIIFSLGKFRTDWLIYYLAFGIVLGNVLFPVWFFQGMEKMKYVALLNILSKLIFTICIFIFIKKKSHYIYVPLINSMGFIIAGILSLLIVLKSFNMKIRLPSLTSIIYHIKDSFQFFLSRASVSIYTSSNVFFLGIFTNNQIVGYYSIAEKFFLAAQGLYQPLANAIYPYMAKNKNKIFFKKLFKFTVIVNTIFCIFLFIFSENLINLFFGSGFQESIIILKIFSLALVIFVPAILLGYPFLAALGYEKYANGSVIIGSLFHLVALIIISQIFINSTVIAFLVVVTGSIVLVIRFFGVKKHNLWRLN